MGIIDSLEAKKATGHRIETDSQKNPKQAHSH
jgi:hypothetical protein